MDSAEWTAYDVEKVKSLNQEKKADEYVTSTGNNEGTKENSISMDLDFSRIHTAVNANELEVGDLVVLADNLYDLQESVTMNAIVKLNEIRSSRENCRFVEKTEIAFSLAYLVCKKRNAEAYKAFQEGKKIEKRIMCKRKDGEWQENWELEDNPDFIYSTLRIVPGTEKYRPFKTNKELLDFWALKIKRQMPELCMPLIWVRDKEDNTVSMINAFIEDNVVSIAAEDIIELDELYEQYTFLDGSPCGIENK